MKVDAEVATGMVCLCLCFFNRGEDFGTLTFLGSRGENHQAKHPQITTYQFPRYAMFTAPLTALLVFCTFSTDPASTFTQLRDLVGGWTTVYASCAFAVIMHTAEAVYHATLCKKHQTPTTVTVSILGHLVGSVFYVNTT
jgi:hypothetical protein